MEQKQFLFDRSDLYGPKASKRESNYWKIDSGISSKDLLAESTYSSPSKMLFDSSLFSKSWDCAEDTISPTPELPVKLKKRHQKKGSLMSRDSADKGADSMNNDTMNNSCQSDVLSSKEHTCQSQIVSDSDSSVTQTCQSYLKKLNEIKKANNNKDNTIVELAPVAFDRNKEVLSQYDENADWQEILRWKQCRRDVGLWVVCSRRKCRKNRFVNEYHDPTDVPKIWYCEMNSDKSLASCDIPEEPIPPAIECDLIENDYNAGSIVWAYVRGYPWWPGIVNDCPDTFDYFMLPTNSLKPNKYYVTFLNEHEFESSWVARSNLKPFKKYSYSQVVKRTKFYGVEHKQRLEESYKQAQSALSLSIFDRLQKYSFLALYNKYYKSNQNSDNNTQAGTECSPSQIPPSYPAREQLPLKDYYLKVICKRSDKL